MFSVQHVRLWLVVLFLPALYNGMVGLQIPILNSSKGAIEPFISGPNPSSIKWSSLVMLYHLGIVVGCFFSAYYSDKYGRKPSLMYVSNVINLLGSVLCLMAKLLDGGWPLYCGRFTLGLGGGFAMAILPVYILECCPRNLRGVMGGIMDTWMTIGNFLSGVLARDDVLGSSDLWPWLVTIGAWPSILGIIVAPLLAETPVYLMNNNSDEEGALKSWTFFNSHISSETERAAVIFDLKQIDDRQSQTRVSWLEAWREHRATLITGAMIGICSATTGTPMLISYSTAFFIRSGISQATSQTVTNIMGGSEIIGGLLATFVNHKVQRRHVFLPMVLACAVSNLILWFVLFLSSYIINNWFLLFGTTFIIIVLVIATNVGPSGLGPVLCVELTTVVTRSKTRTLAVGVGVSIRVLLDLISWPIYDAAGPLLFLVFCLAMIASWFYFRRILPETEGAPLRERLDFMSEILESNEIRRVVMSH